MSQARPIAGSVQQEQGVRTLHLGWLVFFLSTFLVPGFYALQTSGEVLALMEAKGWAKALNTNTFLIDCFLISSACGTAFQTGFLNLFPMLSLAVPAAGLVVYGLKATPRKFVTKDPGLSWWAQAEDKGLLQYQTHDTKRPDNKLLGYIGHLLSVNRDGQIEYPKSIPLYVRMSALAENVLVLGGVGAGKTRGYFRPLIMLAAHLGFTVIVFDLKYPQADSGFFDMIGYWVKRKRKVMMFTPFSPNTMRLPLLDSVEDYASGLSMATTIMPPPEYGQEPGKHYRDRDRGVLAAFLLHLARSDAPNFKELLRMAQWTPNELKKWFEELSEDDPNSEVVLNLKGVFGQGNQEVASVLQGIKNALRIFYNPLVARATESMEGENMDIRAAFREPTLLYIGIQQEYMQEGDGVVLLQLTKRYIDRQLQREAEAQGGSMKRHVAYVLDEFPSFGQLPYMMRSLGVLRSYNVSHHIGVQNLAQLAVVYGDNYSKALTTNVIGRKIFFPLAVDDEEREVFSQHLGMTTVYEFSETDSRQRFMGTDLNESTRQGMNMRKVARPLLSPEEFPHFRPMEAVVKVRGANPIRVFMPAIEDRFLDGPEIPAGLPNRLNELYRQVNPQGENMARFTQDVIRSGALGTSSDTSSEGDTVAYFRTWITEVLAFGARVRYGSTNLERLYLRIVDLPEHLRDLKRLQGNYSRGWTTKPDTDEVRLQKEGLALLDREVQQDIERRAIFGSLDFWLARNTIKTEGHPDREALPEEQRPDVQAIVQDDRVLLSIMACKDLYGVTPDHLKKRVGTKDFIVINRTDPIEFSQALRAAMKGEVSTSREDAEDETAPSSVAPEKPKGKPRPKPSAGTPWENPEQEAQLRDEQAAFEQEAAQLTEIPEDKYSQEEQEDPEDAYLHINSARA